ncbi:MAG: twin-arginine translocation signal domain-containing protein, partial [Bradyrhizobium sp.]|nr:twin-arginine translocation signal domain-containing protein [Bradyrhizobium sp.]
MSRRQLLKAAGALGLAGSGSVTFANIANAASSTIKIGWVG